MDCGLPEGSQEERDHLVVVEEEIRKRLARDLHDGPTQLLASIVMSLGFTKQLIEKAPEYALDEIDQNLQVAHKALKQLRTLLFDLRPVILETQGLIPALQVYSERMNDTEGLNIILTVDAEFDRLNHHAEVAIFSIIQEAINNAKKYAQSSRIDLIVRSDRRNNTLSLFVKDNGQGFDIKQVKSRSDQQGSLGLINMQERAEAVQGRLKIQSETGQGTTIILTLPLLENLLKNTEG